MERFTSKTGNPCLRLDDGTFLVIFRNKKYKSGYRFRATIGEKFRWSLYTYKTPEEAEKAFLDVHQRQIKNG